ncbi:MAG: FAD-linked oxidase [Planctomycetota bacterium]|nr:MAG: FAD-linked oxidase [Planctomycetota bacterium]
MNAHTPPTWRPESVDELAACVRDAAANAQPVVIAGRGTRPGPAALAQGNPARLALDGLDGVLRHSPGDLSLRVFAGLRLADLDALLAEHDQWFPSAAYRGAGSLGGLLASNAEGALQLGYGRAREHLLGASCVHGSGEVARSRGDVVKNVAGYDVARLLVGSHGTLGAYAEVALRVFPRPQRSASLRVELADLATAFTVARHLRATQLEPVFLNVLAEPDLVELVLGFDGLKARVKGQLKAARPLLVPHATGSIEVLEDTSDHSLRATLDDPVGTLGRAHAAAPRAAESHALLHLRAPAAVLADLLPPALRALPLPVHLDARPALGSAWLGIHADNSLSLRDELPALLTALRRRAHVTVHNAPLALRATPEQVWGAPPADFALLQTVKQALDPSGVFAAGRFVGGL